MRNATWAMAMAALLVACTGDKGDDTGTPTTCDTAAAEVCDDEVDNDCDDLIDAEDDDCDTTTGCRSASADCG